MISPLVSIHLIVKDGKNYLRQCLKAALNQDFNDYEILVFDNNSQDKTCEIVEKEFLLPSEASGEGGPKTKLIKFDKNYGLGGGFNKSLRYSNSKYVVLLCVDVILSPNFLSEAVKILESDSLPTADQPRPTAGQPEVEKAEKIGALQPKVLIWDFKNNRITNIIDTTGFEIFKSRRIINRGHGEKDLSQYQEGEIFSYEGACPIFRREALEDAKMPFNNGEYLDEDFGWYADDIDLGWRMRVLGWKSYFSPKIMAWHDRQTTKRLGKNKKDFIEIRKSIPAKKRMLDFRNQRLTLIKNEFAPHFLKDFLCFLIREIQLLIYFLIFEQKTILGIFGFLKLLPKTMKKRKWIMRRKKTSQKEMEKWFK